MDLLDKKCAQCQEIKPAESEFYRSKKSTDGRDSYCKECRNGRHAAFVAKQRESRPSAVPITHRTCSRCAEVKPVSEFYSQAVKRNKPVKCKACKTAEHAEYVKRPEVAARLKEQADNRRSGKWKRPPRREPHAPGYEVCTMCNEDKPLDEFHDHKLGRNGKDSQCRECKSARTKELRSDPEYRRRAALQQTERRFNLESGRYTALLESQGGVCAICSRSPNGRKLHVDHDHSCCPDDKVCGGCVRGLLCGQCNAAIGLLRDDIDLILAAAAYLEHHRLRLAEPKETTVAQICSWCGSADVQAGFDQAQCLACGQFTAADGTQTIPTSALNEGGTVDDITPPDLADTSEPESAPDPIIDAETATVLAAQDE